jgi:hypothetical protein
VIFPIVCTQTTTPLTWLCSATIPSGIGVPPAFPPSFLVPF